MERNRYFEYKQENRLDKTSITEEKAWEAEDGRHKTFHKTFKSTFKKSENLQSPRRVGDE